MIGGHDWRPFFAMAAGAVAAEAVVEVFDVESVFGVGQPGAKHMIAVVIAVVVLAVWVELGFRWGHREAVAALAAQGGDLVAEMRERPPGRKVPPLPGTFRVRFTRVPWRRSGQCAPGQLVVAERLDGSECAARVVPRRWWQSYWVLPLPDGTQLPTAP